MFRLKTILEKLPFGKTRLGSLAVALMLLKEETGQLGNKDVEGIVWQQLGEMNSPECLNTLYEHLDMDTGVQPIGSCTLREEALTIDGDILPEGTRLEIISGVAVDNIYGMDIFEALTENHRTVYVTRDIIEKAQ
jgi:hypothetical protein